MTAVHLGDGAYVSIDGNGDLMVTANHHDPANATDVVNIEARAVQLLVQFINDNFTESAGRE